jgi:hypothetical protein
MTSSRNPSSTDRATSAAPGLLGRTLAEPAFVDWLLLSYLSFELVSVYLGLHGPMRDHFLGYLGALWALYLSVVVAYRSFATDGGRPILDRIYRFAPLVTTCMVYFRLTDIFPIVNPREFDAPLHAIDTAIFGTDLSVWVDPYLTRGIVDWFATWYWLYFPMVLTGVLWAILISKDPARRARFAVGTILCFLLGHTIYTFVPGLGPWHHLADQYQGVQEGGWFFQANWRTYRTGAGYDIFPSLHTAVSTWYSIFLIRERKTWRPARLLAPIVVFITVNVVIATIVLRWHYFIDLVAGATLAVTCDLVSRHALPRYEALRARLGVSPRLW